MIADNDNYKNYNISSKPMHHFFFPFLKIFYLIWLQSILFKVVKFPKKMRKVLK